MKKIGLLGGTSWPSTIPYYEYLNRQAQERLGGFHTANLVLHNANYHPIKSQYTEANGWDKIPSLLLRELQELNKAEPSCIVICNNTLHKAVDILEAQNRLADLPHIIHIADAIGAEARRDNRQKLLLLGTKFTMEDGFYAQRLRDKFTLTVDVPNREARDAIQAMQSEIAAGHVRPEFEGAMADILSNYMVYDGVVLACTELPLVISQDCTGVSILDPIKAQCEAALEFALDS